METFTSGGKPISLEVFGTTTSGPLPVVVVAHGTRGMSGSFGSLIRDYAKFIADNGYLAAIPHYFERSNTAESSDVTGDISYCKISSFAAMSGWRLWQIAWAPSVIVQM